MAEKSVINKINNKRFAMLTTKTAQMPEGTDPNTVVLLRNVNKTYRVFKNKTDIFVNVFHKKEHKVVKALRDINIEVKKGEVVGLIGYNGSGKTTLLKVVSRIIVPDSNSEVYVKGSIGTMIALSTGFVDELTGRENIFYRAEIMGISKDEINQRVEKIIAYSDLKDRIDDPVETYSSGMKARLGFSYYSFIDPDIMIVDEATAVGDIQFKAKARKTISDMFRSGKTVFFVSHNMDEIETYCTRAIVLMKGKIVDEGDPAKLVANYKAGMYLSKKVLRKRKRKLEKLKQIKESAEFSDVKLDDLLDKDPDLEGIEKQELINPLFDVPADETVDEGAVVTYNAIVDNANDVDDIDVDDIDVDDIDIDDVVDKGIDEDSK